MFCKWCGKKIINAGSPCPSCGKMQDPLENGNGFWDLCGRGADARPAPAAVSEKAAAPGHTVKKTEPTRHPVKRRGGGFWVGACVVTVVFLLIAIAGIGIGVGKINDCLDALSSLRSSVSGTNTLLEDGFAKLEEYDRSHLTVLSEQASVVAELEKAEGAKTDLDALSEGDELIMDDEALLVERFKIEDGAAMILLMADGAVLENEELQIFWQKNDDEEDTWNTVAEGIAYLVVEAEEVELYRVICVRIAENGESKLYCAAVAVPDEGVDDALTESGSTEATEPAEATEPEGTVTKPADGQENEENSRTEDNIGETTPAVPGNAADGE